MQFNSLRIERQFDQIYNSLIDNETKLKKAIIDAIVDLPNGYNTSGITQAIEAMNFNVASSAIAKGYNALNNENISEVYERLNSHYDLQYIPPLDKVEKETIANALEAKKIIYNERALALYDRARVAIGASFEPEKEIENQIDNVVKTKFTETKYKQIDGDIVPYNQTIITAIEMETKENMTNDLISETATAMQVFDHELLKMSSHGDASKRCSKNQNKVYTLSRNDKRYKYFYDIVWSRNKGDKTTSFYPNCRHSVSVWIDGDELRENLPPQDQIDYLHDLRQSWRYHERKRREWYERKGIAKEIEDKQAQAKATKYWRYHLTQRNRAKKLYNERAKELRAQGYEVKYFTK